MAGRNRILEKWEFIRIQRLRIFEIQDYGHGSHVYEIMDPIMLVVQFTRWGSSIMFSPNSSSMNKEFISAAMAIVLHVLNYNFTARIEHSTRIFTKILGKNAVYYYAVYLVVSALVRDHFINLALAANSNSFSLLNELDSVLGAMLVAIGIGLNLWTLWALGIKGMYNGDSFGFLMDAPVTTGPYVYFSDPQYFGTTIALLGSSIYYQSLNGLYLTVILYVVFVLSVKLLEEPHMRRLYSHKKAK